MVRLNLFVNQVPEVLIVNVFQKCFNGLSHRSGKNISAMVRTPDEMVGRLIDPTSLRFNLNHGSNPNHFQNCSQEQFLPQLKSRVSLLQEVL